MRARVLRPVLGVVAVFCATAVAAGAAGAPGRSVTVAATGTLELRTTLRLISDLGVCPPGIDANACATRTGTGEIRGLGRVVESYVWSYRLGPPTCPAGVGKPLASTGRLVVAGKGEIQFATADGARCIDEEPLRNEPQELTITGGSGIYAGASGSGRLERIVSAGSGIERWIATLVVPGLEFDLTPPLLSGARSKTVRAPLGATRVRVTYAVTARDGVDGPRPVTCAPRSGSRFPLGRATVRCSATDSSANTSTARFVITVRPRG